MSDDVGRGLEDFPAQFSEQTRTALETSVAELVAALQRHAGLLLTLHGGSADSHKIFAANEDVARLMDAWNERVFDHTGTFPVSLAGLDDDDDDVDDDVPEPADGEPLTIVERWDLELVDAAALVAAGREAHVRTWPDETDDDARVAVESAADALYALRHERGEPWYDVPGIQVIYGARAYLRPDERPEGPSDEEDLEAPIGIPAGELLFSESWV